MNFTPFELVYGKVARVLIGEPLQNLDKLPTYENYIVKLVKALNKVRGLARENIIKSKLKSEEIHDEKIKTKTFKGGDHVPFEGAKVRKLGATTIIPPISKKKQLNNKKGNAVSVPDFQP